MSNVNKAQLRLKFLGIRNGVVNRDKKEQAICTQILKSSFYRDCSAVLLYAASGSEASVDSVIFRVLKDGKKVALPLCLDKSGNMEFYYIKRLDDIRKGMYNIREPDPLLCKKAEHDENTLCIVPGICFDRNGNRLGYGKGYYDRFLQKFNGKTVGIAFEECLTDNLITDEFDKKVNYLITDKKIYDFNIKEE